MKFLLSASVKKEDLPEIVQQVAASADQADSKKASVTLAPQSRLGSATTDAQKERKRSSVKFEGSPEGRDEDEDEGQFYLSGLFNIETSPAFKFLEKLSDKPEVSLDL